LKNSTLSFIQNLRHTSAISTNAKGFTIVELLIVIIVIGILAAIIIVAYNGVTNSAKDSSAKSSAVTLKKKLETYYAEKGTYPSATTTSDLALVTSSTLTGSGVSIGTPDATTGQKTVQLNWCSAPAGATGYKIAYWDYKIGSLPAAQISAGQNAIPCTAWATAAS
jgi:prepilin-type N-terminal cleavage/methylation domain-containing protein